MPCHGSPYFQQFLYSILTNRPTASIILLKQFFCTSMIINAIGSQKVLCLCLLDVSAAFDTIDHDISSWFGTMALSSTGTCHICLLVASVSNVRTTGLPGTHPPAVSLTLRRVHHSSQTSHFLLFPKSSPLFR